MPIPKDPTCHGTKMERLRWGFWRCWICRQEISRSDWEWRRREQADMARRGEKSAGFTTCRIRGEVDRWTTVSRPRW